MDVWREVLEDHPRRGELVAAAQKTVDELFAFIRERRLVHLPEGERVVVAAAPAFDLGLASMHSSPPLEPHPVKSYYYVTDAQASWTPERQSAWLQKFNYATLADISAHEVAPARSGSKSSCSRYSASRPSGSSARRRPSMSAW